MLILNVKKYKKNYSKYFQTKILKSTLAIKHFGHHIIHTRERNQGNDILFLIFCLRIIYYYYYYYYYSYF